MQIEYCEDCRTKLADPDFQSGRAVRVEGRAYCRGCAVKREMELARVHLVGGASAAGGGAGLRVSPGSGIRRPNASSIGQRVNGPYASGNAQRVSPAVGVNVAGARRPGESQTRSGLHRRSTHTMRGVRPPMVASARNMWLAAAGIGIGLLAVGALIVLLLRQ
jgi:hypothetical protein